MADRKPGPFARLDTNLLRSTQPPVDLAPQQSGREDSQPARLPESQISASPEPTPAAPATAKIGYRISLAAVDAVDDIRRLLQRKHRLKTTRQKIVEEAILAAYDDLVKNEQGSSLAQRLASTPDGQTARNPERRRSG